MAEKSKFMDISVLPKTKNGRIKWIESVGFKVPFKYDELSGEVEIVEYVKDKNSQIIIKYNNRKMNIAVGNFTKCAISAILKDTLDITHPELTKEWDYHKNESLTPQDVTPGSHKRVWWKCSNPECNYSWESKIYSRTGGAGCPACAGKAVNVGVNDLATIHPDLIKEWDYQKNKGLTPQDVIHGSHKRVWWKCSNPECNYSWETAIRNRTRGSNCPYCSR